MATTPTLQAGETIETHTAAKIDPKKAKSVANWKVIIQDLVGLLEAMTFSAFIMTWIFHFNSDQTSVLYSLMQLLLIPCMIFSIIIIPIAYMAWFRESTLIERTSTRI